MGILFLPGKACLGACQLEQTASDQNDDLLLAYPAEELAQRISFIFIIRVGAPRRQPADVVFSCRRAICWQTEIPAL